MEPFLGQIQLFGFGWAPVGWALCNGQLLSISSNTALFSLLGTTYGGNGQTTFGLPDLRGRVPVGQGQGPGLSNYDLGEVAGVENVTLINTQMPAHGHAVQGSAGATSKGPAGLVPGFNAAGAIYATGDGTQMAGNMIGASGNGQAHENRQPYLGACYCIATEGIYPSRP
ncbi:MAG TPA: tail fiber protein [Acidimicrobiales bacterium]|nr:tail fiber protein [Acidimicrobiales bacterium]